VRSGWSNAAVASRGNTTGISFYGHSVAETNDDLQALIGAAESFAGPGFLVPMRNTEPAAVVYGPWICGCSFAVNLMTIGLYSEPARCVSRIDMVLMAGFRAGTRSEGRKSVLLRRMAPMS